MSFLKHISQSTFLRGSLIVFIGSNIVSLGNLLYNILMGRFLGPVLYGELGAIFSLLIIVSVPLSVLNLFVVKKVSLYYGQKDKSAILSLVTYLTPKLFILGILISLIMIVASVFLSGFLKLGSFWPLIIISVCFIFNPPSTANKGVLSGTLSFTYITLNGLLETGLKLVISVFLVLLGFKLFGALIGPLVGLVAGYFISRYQLGIILKGAKVKARSYLPKKTLFSSLPFFVTTFGLAVMINLDIIWVKHFFDSKTAGDYVALSTAGKIIYYCLGPVISVMFPLVSSRVKSSNAYLLPLFGTLALALAINFILVFSYLLFPKAILSLLFGSNFTGAAPYMGIFSFFIAIYSLNSVLTYFLLSVSYHKPIYILFLFSLLQSVFIMLYHGDISQVIWINIIVSIFYFIIAWAFVYHKEKRVLITMLRKYLSPVPYGS